MWISRKRIEDLEERIYVEAKCHNELRDEVSNLKREVDTLKESLFMEPFDDRSYEARSLSRKTSVHITDVFEILLKDLGLQVEQIDATPRHSFLTSILIKK